MKKQIFKLNKDEAKTMDLVLLDIQNKIKTENSGVTFDAKIEDASITLDDSSLQMVVNALDERIERHHMTRKAEWSHNLLDVFTKQDRHNIIKEYMPCGMQQPII